MQQLMEAPAEIKVKTRKFSLHKGIICIGFELEENKGKIRSLKLKQRNAVIDKSYLFSMNTVQKGKTIVYHAELNVNDCHMETAFWDVVASADTGNGEYEDRILGGLSTSLKLKLILFPRWTRTKDGNMVYPFVNGARQFTIQYRKYDSRYDSYRFIAKEFLALFCYFILKPYWDRKKIWLICEKYCTMAQDNGLYFFEYCMKHVPEKERRRIYYVIDKNCPDYKAVKQYEPNVIQFMSFRYMIYLSAAQYLISTDAIRHFYIWDSPNSIYKVLYQARKNIVFLQHGVMGFKQCHRTFHKGGGNQMALFVVSSKFEQKIIHDYFGYDNKEIIITGLARWDVLEDHSNLFHKEILLMPTWRSWLEDISEEQFKKSEYYQRYKEFLQDKRLREFLKKQNITLNFYIHPKFREHIGSFQVEDSNIKLIPFGSMPLNQLLMSCNMLITDYSSVSWDVYYQEKPVVFYPFDLEIYENVQGSYMDYKNDVFGDLAWTKDELIDILEEYSESDFKEKKKFAQDREYLLPYRDHDNSKRIYEHIAGADIQGKLKRRLKEKKF